MLHSEVPQILSTLKAILRAKGLNYRDIAGELGIHEATVKRNLNGRGLTLQSLEKIAGVAGLGISDLSEMAKSGSTNRHQKVTIEQESGLAGNLQTTFFLLLLQRKWTPEEIRAEFGICEAKLNEHLLRLDRLGLIRLLPNNKVKLLLALDPGWRPGGPVRLSFNRWLREQFASMDYPRGIVEVESIKISPASLSDLQKMIKQFAEGLIQLGVRDHQVRDDRAGWYSILVAARPINPLQIPDG